jgi:hypothetical protein
VDLKIRPRLAALLAEHLESTSGELAVPDDIPSAAGQNFGRNNKNSGADVLQQQEAERRSRLLARYKAATGVKANRAIYTADGSVHKPEFYDWRSGQLPATSKTTQKLERFLNSNKPPRSRNKSA